LGVSVQDGQITFHPIMLTEKDFKDGELRFTYCGTEIVYSRKLKGESQKPYILSKEQSEHIFARDGKIKQLIIEV